MTNEELNFIHESQSRTTANLEALVARQAEFQAQLEQVTTLITDLTRATYNTIGMLAGHINEMSRNVDRFVDEGRAQGGRIDAVVNIVEKWIAENQRRRNGHGE
jgi:hypothetical protein